MVKKIWEEFVEPQEKKKEKKNKINTKGIIPTVFVLLLGLFIVIFGSFWPQMIAIIVMILALINFIAGRERGKERKVEGGIEFFSLEEENVESGKKLLGPIQVNLGIAILSLIFLAIIFLLAIIISWVYVGLTRGFMISFGIASIIGIFLYMLLSKSTVTIQAVPNNIGIITILGSKTALGKLILVKDGAYVSIGGNGTGRGILDYIAVKIEQVDQDLPELQVVTRENVPIKVLPMITWIPNIWDILDFITAGGIENIKKLLDNIVAQEVAKWAKNRPIEEVLSLNAEQVKKILFELNISTDTEKAIAAIMGITIRAFNLKIASIDPSALKAMTQQFIEQRQQLSESTEMETEKLLALNICDVSATRGEPMTYKEAYKIVKFIKLNREVGVGVVPGLDDAFGKGTAGVVDAAMLAFAGVLPKMAEGRPVDVSKEQEKSLAKGTKQAMGNRKGKEEKETRGGKNKGKKTKEETEQREEEFEEDE